MLYISHTHSKIDALVQLVSHDYNVYKLAVAEIAFTRRKPRAMKIATLDGWALVLAWYTRYTRYTWYT